MGDKDKLDNFAEEKFGEAKEAVGKAADDKDLESEGKADQLKGNLKQAGEKLKDAFK
ncbi:MAG: CsbD family protein [Nocardioides sp.]|uniref:CsbD family protein n=1 Tax=Nocardioides sp. TaxID=35761 RepID=UPI0039E5591E